jgi:hypothetical protein
MTPREELVRAKVGFLAMAAELNNITKACKLAGVSRSQFYAMKKAYELYGRDGLTPRVRRKPEMPNRTPAQLEEQILLQTRKYPHISYVRLAGEMRSKGGNVTPAMVRYVWQRHGLSTRLARLAWAKGFDGSTKTAGNSCEVGVVQEFGFSVSGAASVNKPLKDSNHI